MSTLTPRSMRVSTQTLSNVVLVYSGTQTGGCTKEISLMIDLMGRVPSQRRI